MVAHSSEQPRDELGGSALPAELRSRPEIVPTHTYWNGETLNKLAHANARLRHVRNVAVSRVARRQKNTQLGSSSGIVFVVSRSLLWFALTLNATNR